MAAQKKTFASLLKGYRKAKNLSPAGLARNASLFGKISRSYITRLEAGSRKPSYDKVLMLAKALQLDLDETDELLLSANQIPGRNIGGIVPALNNPVVVGILKLFEDPLIPPEKKLEAQRHLAWEVDHIHAALTAITNLDIIKDRVLDLERETQTQTRRFKKSR